MQDEKQRDSCVWNADQPWRQGSVISGEIAAFLGLRTDLTSKGFAIVASHDCDCVTGEDEEPQLELVLGREIEKEEFDGNFAHAKSTRRLHLEIEQHRKYIELRAVTKANVDKTVLLGQAPSKDLTLNTDQRRIFRRWLAARYDRVSFPDELVRRLRPVAAQFKKASKKDGANIIGIYIQFEPDEELVAGNAEPYSFKISVVFDSSIADASQAAERIAKSLKASFTSEFKILDTITGDHWNSIELQSCEVRSDIDFALQEVLSSYVFRLDEVSLNIGDQGKIPPQ